MQNVVRVTLPALVALWSCGAIAAEPAANPALNKPDLTRRRC
jgi:hypothetical protein